jgi:succinate--hydroxymethylglutarate CoA-transferase
VIGEPGLINDERFKTNSLRAENVRELKRMIDSALAQHTTAWWLEKLNENRIPCAKINTTADLFQYDHLKARNMFAAVEGEADFKVVGNPVKFKDEFDDTEKGKPPFLGEHNDLILREILGLSEEEVGELIEEGVISPRASRSSR